MAAPTIDISTGLGYPKKADDAKRNPRVSLLFSDPTGSGMDGAGQVLVQGIAEVDDADLAANRERYWRESSVKLPATRKMHPPKPVRALLGWYYTRIYVLVRPERVFVWPGPDAGSEPEIHDCHLEEVRSGHTEEPGADHGAPIGGRAAWDGRVDELGRDTRPRWSPGWRRTGSRCRSACRSASTPAKAIHLEAEPAGLPLIEGRACLTVHRHAPDFTWQNNFQVRGDLERHPDGLAPRSPQARRRIRAPEGLRRPEHIDHEADGPLLPNRQEAGQAGGLGAFGKGSIPAFHGPGL